MIFLFAFNFRRESPPLLSVCPSTCKFQNICSQSNSDVGGENGSRNDAACDSAKFQKIFSHPPGLG
jgi:hypothetical protein